MSNDKVIAPGQEPKADESRPARGEGGQIGDLTLLELIERGARQPRPTWRVFRLAMTGAQAGALPAGRPSRPTESASRARDLPARIRSLSQTLGRADALQLLLYAIAILMAVAGSALFRGGESVPRADGHSMRAGAPFLWLGFLLWIAGDLAGRWTRLQGAWQRMNRRDRLRFAARVLPALAWVYALHALVASMTAPRELVTGLVFGALSAFAAGCALWLLIEFAYRRRPARAGAEADEAEPAITDRPPLRRSIWAEITHRRKLLFALAALCSLVVWANTGGNRIEPPIIALWLLSVALWAFVFAPLRWNFFDWASGRIDAARRLRPRDHRWTIVALLLIMLLGGAFRFSRLDTHPPQMYSDLVEKIQDAYKIRHLGDTRVFFANIGGREPLHFYLLSILASQPGMAFDHYALKLMSALESWITLPLISWLGVEVMDPRRRKGAWLFGLLAAALVAVSFWHVVIGRQGMRISLAPLFSALTAIYLVRALRYNRRSDYVKAGLALGFGLMGYQAARMLPAAAVAGVAIAMCMGRRSGRKRLSYLLNLAALAFVALMVFLPLLHYWTEAPDEYMRRTNTRIFGDAPRPEVAGAAFILDSAPALMSNIRKTALMYHYHGDSTWVSAVGHEPAMDPVTAAFMLLGVAAWLGLLLRSRDPAPAFVLAYLVTMLLPTALALAFPIEVPSFIRASGAIPPSYLIAALPLALFCRQLRKTLAGRMGIVAAAAFAIGALLAANHYNSSLYFGEFSDNFARASHPQAQAGKILRGFAESDGAYGNAFVLTSPHWWDVRAVGIEAGLMFWDSGGSVEILPWLLAKGLRRAGEFRLDAERDLLFFYSAQNDAAPKMLSEWFPGGRATEIQVVPAHKSFYVFRAPALGADGLERFLSDNA